MIIYIIYNKSTKMTKIGVTENLDKRVNQLQHQSGCELYVVTWADVEHAFETEKFLHATFQIYRKFGEWFLLDENAMDFLRHFWHSYFFSHHEEYSKNKPIFNYEIPIENLRTPQGNHKFMVFDDEKYKFMIKKRNDKNNR